LFVSSKCWSVCFGGFRDTAKFFVKMNLDTVYESSTSKITSTSTTRVDGGVIRFLFKLILCLLLALGAGFGNLALRSGDPLYVVYEWISPARFRQYDRLIASVAAEYHLDPMLLKAVVWRESRFDPQKYGSAGERGLMQVSEKAANEWARERKIDNFRPEQLFQARPNLEAGGWYLRRALDHWANQADPLPFALAEYNAGPSRAQRWAGDNQDATISTNDFINRIDFPATRKYVDSIIERYQFYKRRGRM
jgi:soluble lytic murein transglycosylase